ncbi:MAG: hypothetical protein IJK39_08055 [Bacteroidales bacterium]|nr:hypothetical protein [Bacteroidales bacterium]
MKKALHCLLLTLTICFPLRLFAQLALVNEPDKPSVQAAEITKYGKQNVQLYTGRLSLNIPVYVYRDADFTIPVSLSYSYNGLVVNRQPGVAGLGWVLECGGYITREVFGIPDESIGEYHTSILPGGTISSQPLNGFDSLFTNMTPFICPEYIYSIHSPGDVPKMIWQLQRNGKTVYYESSPDIYHFNFLGRSGSFVRNMDGTFSAFHTSTFDGDYRIEKTSAYVGQAGDLTSQITITTSDGYKYIFGDITGNGYRNYTERSVSSAGPGTKGDGGGEEKTQTISFLLKEIHAPNGRVACFRYNEKGEHCEIKNFSPALWHYTSTSDNYRIQSNESLSTVSYLSSIDIDGEEGVFTFDYSERTGANSGSYVTPQGRRSLQGWESYLLDSIQTPAGTTHLDYEYNSVGSRYPFLSRIRQDGIGDYAFSYEGISDRFFPAYGTTAKDHWGYYNTTDTSTANQNFISLSDISSLTGYEETLLSRDNSNFMAASIGIVREMVYPYGGKTVFRWEANDFSRRVKKEASEMYRPVLGYTQSGEISSAPGARIKSYTNYDAEGVATDSTRFSYNLPDSQASSGILTVYPRYRIGYGGKVGPYPVVVQYAYSGGLTRYDAVPVEYSSVTEHHPDGSKTIHNFSSFLDTGDDFPAVADAERTARYVDDYNTYYANLQVTGGLERVWNILSPPISHQHQRGKETGSQVFNSSGTLLAESSSTFGLDEQREPLLQYLYVGDAFMPTQRILAADLLRKTTSKTYFQNNSSVSSQVQYTYNNLGQKSSEVKSLSNGDIITTTYTFIPDIAENRRTAVQKKMYSKGLVGSPVKVTVKSRIHGTSIDRIMSSDSLTFDSLQRAGTTTLFLPKKWSKRDVETGVWKDYASYIHDNKGNIIQKTDANGISTTFIWYSDNLGVALRVDNATAAQVTSALVNSPFGGISTTETESIASTLRTALPQSEVSWYKWWSYGLPSKICDPTGRITHYTYDAAQRLNIIRDDSLDPVERYDYQTLTR